LDKCPQKNPTWENQCSSEILSTNCGSSSCNPNNKKIWEKIYEGITLPPQVIPTQLLFINLSS